MSVFMFAVGAVVSFAGLVLVVFGLPDKEFSFGNTLIIAGSVAFVGGLIVISLGALAAQLQRVAQALGDRQGDRQADGQADRIGGRKVRPPDAFEQPARIPFPPKPKTHAPEPVDEQSMADEPRGFAPVMPSMMAAPMMPNPVEAIAEAEAAETPLSPRHIPNSAPRPAFDMPVPPKFTPSSPPHATNGSGPATGRGQIDTGWRPAPEASRMAPSGDSRFFESMWPSKPHAASGPAEGAASGRAEEIAREPADARRAERLPPMPQFPPGAAAFPVSPGAPATAGNDARAVAVLKSGVVDGMGYTLYVDGSIEAELPAGTLRFASINELRSHLDKGA